MGSGYTRQSAADIQTGETIEAAPLNAEFNTLQSAFDSALGHTHDGTTGEGPKISLTSAVSGILPAANGGIGGINKLDATVAPTVNEDSGDGYVVGSLWVDVTNDVVYICVDNTLGAAVWKTYQPLDAGLTSISGLTTSANKMIYTTASDTYATTDLSVYGRTLIDDADASTALSTLGVSTYAKTLLDDADASTALTTLGVSTYAKTLLDDADASASRATLGVSIGSDVQAYDATLDAFASYNTNGLITQTSANTFTGRTLTGTSNEITVANGNGVSGNPTISIPATVTLTGKTLTGGTLSGSSFLDNVEYLDPVNNTKRGRIDVGGVTAGQSRVFYMPDRDVYAGAEEMIGSVRDLAGLSAVDWIDLSPYTKLFLHTGFSLSSSSSIYCRYSSDNGVTFGAVATEYATGFIVAEGIAGATPTTLSTAQNFFDLAMSAGIASFDAEFCGFNRATLMGYSSRGFAFNNGTGNLRKADGFGYHNSSTARNALRLFTGTSWASGYAYLTGVRG